MGKKGRSQTTVQSYKPTKEEVRIQKQMADYGDAVAPNALALNKLAANMLFGSYGAVQADYDKMNRNAQNQIALSQLGNIGLQQGVLPQAYQNNMQDIINRGVQTSIGGTLNNLAGRGVLNSSVTNKAMGDISNSAANAMADAYQSNVGLLSNLYGQGAQMAGQPISISAAAQEAAQTPAMSAWNASMGLNQGGSGSALQAIAGQGQTTQNMSYRQPSNVFGGLLTGIAGNAGLFGGFGNNCFSADTKIRMADDTEREIRDIVVGDKVLCPSVYGADVEEEVIEVMTPEYNDVYIVVAKDGIKDNSVSTTLSQPLLNDKGDFVLVQDLRMGDGLSQVGRVTAVIHSGERKVYDIKLTGENQYYANGFIAKGGTYEW